jgi:hypothetical protein
MKLILIENKIYKVPKKTYETIKMLENDHDGTSWPNEELQKMCERITKGESYGARYLGDVEFTYSELPF